MMEALGLILLFIGIILSIRSRKYLLMWRTERKPSLLSSAITQLVGTAGGITSPLNFYSHF